MASDSQARAGSWKYWLGGGLLSIHSALLGLSAPINTPEGVGMFVGSLMAPLIVAGLYSWFRNVSSRESPPMLQGMAKAYFVVAALMWGARVATLAS